MNPQPQSSNPSHWLGSETQTFYGELGNIANKIPSFDRQPFSLGQDDRQRDMLNPRLDIIARLAASDDEVTVPVGLVSQSYQLVQHSEVIERICDALKAVHIEPDSLQADLTLSGYGERMGLHITLPVQYEFDPGDGHQLALQIGCYNSVDGSTRFRAVLGWLRFVCSNGMVVGAAQTDYRKRHTQTLDIEAVGALLEKGLTYATQDKARLTQWVKTPVQPNKIVAWSDGPVRTAWGVKAATRALHIARTGCDVQIPPFTEKALPSKKEVIVGQLVPSSNQPAKNLYAVSQVLTWLAQQRTEIEERLEWQNQVPELMEKLAQS